MGAERCELVWVADSGHSPHLEKADFVAQTIAAWLAKELPVC